MKARKSILKTVVMLFLAAALTIFGVAGSGWAAGNDYVEQVGASGKINWSAGYIEAVGTGAPPDRFLGKPQARPMALRAAQVDAYRNLLEATQGVRIDSETTVKDFVVESDVIKAQVEGLVKGAQILKKDYFDDGTVEVTLRMPLASGLGQVVYPNVLKTEPSSLQPGQVVTPTEPGEVTTPPISTAVVYTGLVIDARGLQVRPAMSPKVLDESGQEVYGTMFVDREYAVQQGMSGYAREIGAAQSNPRVTNNPITVKGLNADGPGKSNIVISNAEANQLRASAENLSFLKKCRVMIVLD